MALGGSGSSGLNRLLRSNRLNGLLIRLLVGLLNVNGLGSIIEGSGKCLPCHYGKKYDECHVNDAEDEADD